MMQPMQETVGFAIAQLCKAHRNSVAAKLSELGLHVGQEMILVQLWEEEGLAQSQLVERMCVEPPTLTKMLQRIEREGFVERRPDAEDARVSRVYLTERGRSLREAVEAVWREVEVETIKGMTSEERMLFRRFLMQARTNLDADH
jgi:MarR family transcriptional regulator, organic hydroperoxide resistance regulator